MAAPPKPIDLLALGPDEAIALATVLDTLGEVVEITRPDGTLIYVNKAFEDTTGYAAHEALGRTPAQLLRDDTHDAALYDAIWDLVLTGKQWNGEFTGRRKDGSRYHQLVRVRAVHVEGELAFLLAVKRPLDDATGERRKHAAASTMEAELQAVRTRLHSANEELVATASMAMVGQLAAAVGHEINNPAQVLRSCLEHLNLQRDSISSADMVEVLEDAMLALQRIETVTAEMVPFASSTAETQSAVDMNVCVRRGLRIAHNELRHRTQIVDALGDLPEVHGFEARLSQLMTGLLVSLARSMEEDSESNLVTLRSDFDERAIYIRIDCQVAASDSFFANLQERLAGDGASLGTASGQRISLIMCRQIAIAHGGDLTIESLGEGGARLSVQIARGSSTSVSDRKRVLIIDDEELILRSLRRMLRDRYEVDVIDNGRDAIDLICRNDYAAIVCDMMMPGMSGVAVYEAVNEQQPAAVERMVFISAGTFTEKTRDFVNATRNPVLSKPLSQDEFLTTIDKISRAGSSAR